MDVIYRKNPRARAAAAALFRVDISIGFLAAVKFLRHREREKCGWILVDPFFHNSAVTHSSRHI